VSLTFYITEAATFSLSPTNQFDIELNKESMRISSTSTHAAELNHVNVTTYFLARYFKFHGEEGIDLCSTHWTPLKKL
jgi:hypothetical protein